MKFGSISSYPDNSVGLSFQKNSHILSAIKGLDVLGTESLPQ